MKQCGRVLLSVGWWLRRWFGLLGACVAFFGAVEPVHAQERAEYAPPTSRPSSLPASSQKADTPNQKADTPNQKADTPKAPIFQYEGNFGKKPTAADTPVVRGGIYDRPYIGRLGTSEALGGMSIALGGYTEFLGRYILQEGLTDGFSFEARRFNLFVFSSIGRFVRLTAELEFEQGTSSIALETALVDFRFHRAFVLRGGILLPPIGRFNIAHDGPRYDVIDRPLVSTRVIPSTYSDIGFGATGSFFPALGHKLYYEIYAVNGLRSGIINDSPEGTRIARGKSLAIFAANENGSPALTGRIAYAGPSGLEVGFSGYVGIYNRYRDGAEEIDRALWLKIFAVDAEISLGPVTIRTEAAVAWIDIPDGLVELFADTQWGIYADVIWEFWKGRLGFLRESAFRLVGRVDYVDLHVGRFASTGQDIGDETLRLTLALSFRPYEGTSLRVEYQHSWLTDRLGNVARRAGVQFGVATYF